MMEVILKSFIGAVLGWTMTTILLKQVCFGGDIQFCE
jgi:hypothetical protein